MPDMRKQAVSSTDVTNLRLAIKDAVDDSVDQLLQIQDNAGPLTPESFERVELQTLEVCMDLKRRILQGILENRDAQLPDVTEQGGRALRRRKATPKTVGARDPGARRPAAPCPSMTRGAPGGKPFDTAARRKRRRRR